MRRLFQFFKNLFVHTEEQRTSSSVEPSEPSEEKQMPSEKPELPRLDAAVSYNGQNVPIFAPNGFPPSFAGTLNDFDAGTEDFAFEVGRVQQEMGIGVDGFCGPTTIQKMAEKDRDEQGVSSGIFIGPRCYEIENSNVRTFADEEALAGLKGRRRSQAISQLVLHYDVTFSSESTISVLRQRGLSYHFLVDGDDEATIFQLSNPTLNVAFHAGPVNNYSLGICLNNPAEPKYQNHDAHRRGRKREILADRIHGSTVKLLKFFPEQIDAANKLGDVLCESLGIRRRVPKDEKGNTVKTVVDDIAFAGVVGHYHVSKSKIDPAPLDWDQLTFAVE